MQMYLGFPAGSDSKESACNAGDSGLSPWSRRSSGEVNSYPLSPGEFLWQRSLVGYSPWSLKESDTTDYYISKLEMKIVNF